MRKRLAFTLVGLGCSLFALACLGGAAFAGKRTPGWPVTDGQWYYKGVINNSTPRFATATFEVTPMEPIGDPPTAILVKFDGLDGAFFGVCPHKPRRDNLIDFHIPTVQVPVTMDGKFSIKKRSSHGSLGPGTVKIAGSFKGENGPKWSATAEVRQRQIGYGWCTGKAVLRAVRKEQTG